MYKFFFFFTKAVPHNMLSRFSNSFSFWNNIRYLASAFSTAYIHFRFCPSFFGGYLTFSSTSSLRRYQHKCLFFTKVISFLETITSLMPFLSIIFQEVTHFWRILTELFDTHLIGELVVCNELGCNCGHY